MRRLIIILIMLTINIFVNIDQLVIILLKPFFSNSAMTFVTLFGLAGIVIALLCREGIEYL